MRLRFWILVILLPALLGAAQTKRALLIGIDNYQPEGTTAQHPAGCAYGRCELGSFQNLDGAVNDARAMADLLTSPKFGFPAAQVVLLANPVPPQPSPGLMILPAAQTTREGILAAMQKYLVDVPGKGDTVLFYDAGHGSLRVNSKGNKITVLMNGAYVHADSTLVPADAYKGGFDVRDREMTRIFQAALDKGVHLTVIFDSCHSGGATRGLGEGYRARTLAYDPRDIAEAPDVTSNGLPRVAPTERIDNPALVFSAAQQDQEADEAVPTPAQPESHGAFTAALIEALEVLPADAPASMVYQRVKVVLEGNSLTHQEPDLDATAARREQPLFGTITPSDAKKMRAAVLKADSNGKIWLDTGQVAGIGVGSEFASIAKGTGGVAIRLRVTSLEGIARSAAQVSPAGEKVAVGDVFELAKWVPAQSAPLRMWLWPASLGEREIRETVEQVKLSGAALIQDPAEYPWTDMLFWDGTNWMLQHAGQPHSATDHAINVDSKAIPAKNLGGRLFAESLKKHLSADAKLWVNLPPSRELAEKLALHDGDSAVQAAPDIASANYVLAGAVASGGPVYAWFDKTVLDAGPRVKTTDHSPGCSATSQYPVRSDWVVLSGEDGIEGASVKLNHYASLLAKVYGWIQLADNPTAAAATNYYGLEILHVPDAAVIAGDQKAKEDDELQMALKSAIPITERRWVYVLDIDCHGKGSLLYPRDLTENQFPSDADNGLQFALRGAPTLRVGPPFGVDTLVMLSTEQPLPDPYALEFEGVATRGAAASGSPLDRLLTNTSRGLRGSPSPVPTNWGLDLLTLHSVPKDAAK